MPIVTIGRFVLAVSLIYLVYSFSFAQAPGSKAADLTLNRKSRGTWREQFGMCPEKQSVSGRDERVSVLRSCWKAWLSVFWRRQQPLQW